MDAPLPVRRAVGVRAAGSPPPGPVSGVRWFLRIGVVLILLVATVAVAGEVVLRPIVERRLAGDIARRYALTEMPSVDLRGRPFLVRALQGRLDGARVAVSGYQTGGLRIEEASLEADDVRFELGSVLGGEPDATAGRVEARVVVTDGDFSRYLRDQGIDLDVRLAPGVATARGTIDVAGFAASGTATGALTLTEATLRFVPSRVELTGPLPVDVGVDPRAAFDFELPVPEVAGVRVTGVELGAGAATFTADVTDYALAGAPGPLHTQQVRRVRSR